MPLPLWALSHTELTNRKMVYYPCRAWINTPLTLFSLVFYYTSRKKNGKNLLDLWPVVIDVQVHQHRINHNFITTFLLKAMVFFLCAGLIHRWIWPDHLDLLLGGCCCLMCNSSNKPTHYKDNGIPIVEGTDLQHQSFLLWPRFSACALQGMRGCLLLQGLWPGRVLTAPTLQSLYSCFHTSPKKLFLPAHHQHLRNNPPHEGFTPPPLFLTRPCTSNNVSGFKNPCWLANFAMKGVCEGAGVGVKVWQWRCVRVKEGRNLRCTLWH